MALEVLIGNDILSGHAFGSLDAVLHSTPFVLAGDESLEQAVGRAAPCAVVCE